MELRCGEPRAAGGGAGAPGASLAGGRPRAVHRVARPQEPDLPARGKAPKLPAGVLGPLPGLGSRNTKPNALSRQFAASSTDHAPELILPSACIIEVATWQIEEQVREAQRSIPDPVGAPPNTLFVPEAACCEVLQWKHSSKLACHHGLARTLHLVHQRFWWPSMTRDTRTYIAACPFCARGKS